ncbi:uncharacterized protein MELLADRAFT_84095 [Melampsora larici-populina 98AG31]|uniref:Uncharacterized protein n=1 Tax=Melampsora larici-populina (strain 98AG31 / pathotype 3-4-7) TaxID=747676 RepID=F4SBH0_MELLP|nr:uncharacterized protein MELLADRAFT_84095 [Melampsora larici-populina 98AG31]EGF98006.1 hypothetical protein MELLADRAFT_84095 [Melampsora larici-populina 98AG31]
MRNTRSQQLATASVARPTNRSSKKSNRPKRRLFIELTETNRKRININACSTRRPVSLVNRDFKDEDDSNDKEDEDEDSNDKEDEDEEVFNPLATRINTKQQGCAIAQAINPSASDNEVDKESLPSIKEYKNVLDQWPPAQIAVVARSQKKKGTTVPPSILSEARAFWKLYKQQKAMLSIMGNIIANIKPDHRGELGGRRKPGCYQIWLKYSKERQKHWMPLKGGPEGILANRNWKLGKIWKSLPKEHQEVFHPSVFYVLSRLTPPSSDSDVEDDDNDENEIQAQPRLELEPEHWAELQALYYQLPPGSQ